MIKLKLLLENQYYEGDHWIYDISDFHEQMISNLYEMLLNSNYGIDYDECDDAYLITAKVPINKVNWRYTLMSRIDYPYEFEITLKDGTGLTLQKLEKFYD